MTTLAWIAVLVSLFGLLAGLLVWQARKAGAAATGKAAAERLAKSVEANTAKIVKTVEDIEDAASAISDPALADEFLRSRPKRG